MTITTSSRGTSLPGANPTLADLLAGVLADPNLTDRSRQDRASAVRTLAKALGKPIGDIPAHPGIIRERMKGFSPAVAGLTRARWANTKSLVLAAMRDAGLAHMPGRYTEPLAPAWATLFARLKDPMMRFGLSRMAHYFSAKGTDPEQVDDTVLAGFLADLRAGGLTKDPRQAHRMACRAWNKASSQIPGWPAHKVTVPSYVRTYAVPWESLPSTLTADAEDYLRHLAGDDILTDGGFKPLRPISVATRRRQLHGFVSALIRHGHSAEQFRTLADVIAPDKVRDGIRFIVTHARSVSDGANKEAGREHAGATAIMLRSIARHWVKVDAATETKLTEICRQLKPTHRGLRTKNRRRLLQLDDQNAVDRLMSMPHRLVSSVRHNRKPGRNEAFKVQLAVAVELFMMTQLRLKNLLGLAVGSTLNRSRDGTWSIAFADHETKNSRPIEKPLPQTTGRMLDLYIDIYRPILAAGPSDWLFPGRHPGTAKSADMMRQQITEGVAEHAGLVVNPHLFRHMIAKIYLKRHRGDYGTVSQALTHASINTTMANYCGTEVADNLAHFDAQILKLQEQAIAATRRSGRKNPAAGKTAGAKSASADL